MAYNEKLEERIRAEFGEIPFVEKKMFGGVGFLVHGNMACGVYKNDMIVRVAPEKHEKLLKKKHTKVFDITGRLMKGWLMVGPDGWKSAKQLSIWVKKGVEFALTLPGKILHEKKISTSFYSGSFVYRILFGALLASHTIQPITGSHFQDQSLRSHESHAPARDHVSQAKPDTAFV